MKLDIFLQKTANLSLENRILKLIVVVIGITVLINTVMTYRALNSHRTILVPPVINSRIEIAGDKASEEYIKSFTRYLCGLAFSYTSATARGQFDELLTMYAPDAFPEAKRTFYSLADSIETAKNTNAFYIQGLKVDIDRHQIEVIGLKRQFVEDRMIDSGIKTYIIEYRIENGRFMINKITEKEA
jgi:conjugal transfer pilus assembly protein TraE